MESSLACKAKAFEDKIRAKRLTASMESSLYKLVKLFSGIEVLNALRHQWNLHATFGWFDGSVSEGAKRLTASMESSL